MLVLVLVCLIYGFNQYFILQKRVSFVAKNRAIRTISIYILRTLAQQIPNIISKKRVLQHCMKFLLKFLPYLTSSVARFYGSITPALCILLL